ncbi:MAG: hypothetical protein C4329_15795 [Chitinophagaceae bacterium]
MQPFRWFGLIAAIILIVACYLPWATIPIGNVIVTGMQTEGTGFGKPGIMHIALSAIFILFLLVNKNWSKRANLLIIALNTGWALRNMIIIPACHMGACPKIHIGFYTTLIAAILVFVSGLLVDYRTPKVS